MESIWNHVSKFLQNGTEFTVKLNCGEKTMEEEWSLILKKADTNNSLSLIRLIAPFQSICYNNGIPLAAHNGFCFERDVSKGFVERLQLYFGFSNNVYGSIQRNAEPFFYDDWNSEAIFGTSEIIRFDLKETLLKRSPFLVNIKWFPKSNSEFALMTITNQTIQFSFQTENISCNIHNQSFNIIEKKGDSIEAQNGKLRLKVVPFYASPGIIAIASIFHIDQKKTEAEFVIYK